MVRVKVSKKSWIVIFSHSLTSAPCLQDFRGEILLEIGSSSIGEDLILPEILYIELLSTGLVCALYSLTKTQYSAAENTSPRAENFRAVAEDPPIKTT